MAIIRELDEEMGYLPSEVRFYFSYVAKLWGSEDYQRVNCYVVDPPEEVKMMGEITQYCWYSRENYEANEPKISPSTYEFLIPKLLEGGMM